MKKLYIVLIACLTLITLPGLQVDAALTPPASYDYEFSYDSTDGEFQFKDGTNSYTPEFTRTADGIYFNYEYIGDADGLLPFEITLRFNRSTTSWTLGTTGYIATDTNIGSDNTVGGIQKFFFSNNNNTDNDYVFFIDASSTPFEFSIDIDINNIRYFQYTVANRNNINDARYPILAHTNNNALDTGTSSIRYFDAFYWQDLGTSAAVQTTTGYQSGYDDGFGDGYLVGVAEDNAYAIGYSKGLVDGGDMETGSSIIILVLAALSFGFMIFGFSSKKRIFNLFAAGLFIALGGLMIEFPAFIVISIGFVIFNIWYTFGSD